MRMDKPRAICLGYNCRVHGPDHLCDNCQANEYIDELEDALKEWIADGQAMEAYIRERRHREEAAQIKMSWLCGLEDEK